MDDPIRLQFRPAALLLLGPLCALAWVTLVGEEVRDPAGYCRRNCIAIEQAMSLYVTQTSFWDCSVPYRLRFDAEGRMSVSPFRDEDPKACVLPPADAVRNMFRYGSFPTCASQVSVEYSKRTTCYEAVVKMGVGLSASDEPTPQAVWLVRCLHDNAHNDGETALFARDREWMPDRFLHPRP